MNKVTGVRPVLRDAQQEEEVCSCQWCGGEVYRGEMMFEWMGKWVCVDCFQSELSSWLARSPEEAARELGFACRSSLTDQYLEGM